MVLYWWCCKIHVAAEPDIGNSDITGHRPSLLIVIYTPHAYMFKLISNHASKLIQIDV